MDLTGQVYGRLTVVRQGDTGADGDVRWECLCLCGAIKTVRARNLRDRKYPTRSCGCLRSDVSSELMSKVQHLAWEKARTGRTPRHPLYNTWASMKQRCQNPNDKRYPQYGERGIRVCDRWQSFGPFLSDMGERPQGMSLDRIDGDGDYEPSNCRWATAREQAANKTTVTELRREVAELRAQVAKLTENAL